MAFVSEDTLNRTRYSHSLYTRVTIMTFDFITTDEITGVVIGNPSYTNDSTSDIRRTMTIELYPTDSTFDIVNGSKVWMDKYVKVEIGVKGDMDDNDSEPEYYSMGIFVIDNPSKTYSETENKLTLNCLDLMSRLTGIRGGVIEGIEHVIPSGSNVRETIIAILKEGRISRYVVDECTIDVPNDITVDGGSSLYDMLNELVKLLPNYQIYFDVDGVFHYELIPNGVAEPVMVDDSIWQNVLINYDIAYDFENVKNCIEILGGAHDSPFFTGMVNYDRSGWGDIEEGDTVSYAVVYNESLTSDESIDEFIEEITGVTANEYLSGKRECGNGYICIEFEPFVDFVGRVLLESIVIRTGDGDDIMTIHFNPAHVMDVTENDSVYLYIKPDKINNGYTTNSPDPSINWWTEVDINASVLGGYQPRATIYETNPDSPFFDSINYHCDCAYNEDYTRIIDGTTVDVLKLYCDTEYTNIDDSLKTMVFQYSLSALSGAKTQLSDLRKTNTGYCAVEYYFIDGGRPMLKNVGQISASLLLMGTHIARYNDGGIYDAKLIPYSPNTLGTLRVVLSGDEYDNIWSDDLAKQRAKFELYQRCRLLDTVTLTILPIYWLDVNWLVELTLPNETGTEETNQYLIKSISTDGGVNGTQTVTLMRYYPYYPSIN